MKLPHNLKVFAEKITSQCFVVTLQCSEIFHENFGWISRFAKLKVEDQHLTQIAARSLPLSLSYKMLKNGQMCFKNLVVFTPVMFKMFNNFSTLTMEGFNFKL